MQMKKYYSSMIRSATVLLFLLISVPALAQERVITGRVTDVAGNPIPGVNVIIKGTTTGTATDGDGTYSIELPKRMSFKCLLSGLRHGR